MFQYEKDIETLWPTVFFFRIQPKILEQAVNTHNDDRYLSTLQRCLQNFEKTFSWELEGAIKKFWSLEATLLVEIEGH